MWNFTFWILLSMFHWTTGQIDSSAPDCALCCWENTKYVSQCINDNVCLCNDTEYQNSVFQCLYSQCDSSQFASALHHTISQCAGTGGNTLPAIPPTQNHDSLRRREAEYLAGAVLYGSGSAENLPIQSAGFITQSVSFLTESVANPYTQNAPSSTPPYFPLQTATAPAMTSATPTEQAYSAVAASTTAGPLLFTGIAQKVTPYLTLYIMATVVTIYLSS